MQSRLRAVVAALTILALPLPGIAPAFAAAPPSGALEGRVLAAEGDPVEGAVILVRSLEDFGERESQPTGPDGAYALAGLPAGEYEIAVRTERGLYLGDRSLRVSGLGGQSYSFRVEDRPTEEIVSYAEKQGDEEGKGEDPEKDKKKRRKGAAGVPRIGWDNPLVVLAAGIAFIVGAGALIEATDNDDDDEDNDGSPSVPQ